jgi:hypothetical protein
MNYNKKYLKYKNKYLTLKSQYGGIEQEHVKSIFIPETEFLTNCLLPTEDKNYYYNQNLFSYWISSSHNTYLPYDQLTGESSVCYYFLQSMTYHGGCLEIDTDRIEGNDIIITHLSTNSRTIKLSSVLQIIKECIDIKKEKKILGGPIILNFDNKNLKTPKEYKVFWDVIKRELLDKGDYVSEIGKSISEEKISDLDNKILFRWSENKKCNDKDIKDDTDVSSDICPPNKDILKKISSTYKSWIHLLKGNSEFENKILPCSRNETTSIQVSLFNEINEPNYNLICNSQRNIIRTFPHFSSMLSGNYSNMKYFRDGIQMTALNIQKIDNPWYLNSAIFLLKNIKSTNSKEEPLAYRLKPLWLLGLIPHPGYYNLNIKCATKINLLYGLTNINENGTEINFVNIDITIPFFVIECQGYKFGVEIPWNFSKLKDKLTVNLYKIEKSFINNFNEVKMNKTNHDLDCRESSLLNSNISLPITIYYEWTKSKDNIIKSLEVYNEKINKLRTNYKYKDNVTKDFLDNLRLFNNYQDDLAKSMVY